MSRSEVLLDKVEPFNNVLPSLGSLRPTLLRGNA